MSSQANSYEVALFGEFFARDLKAILNRITLHSESSHRMHTREVVFEPIDAQHREMGNEAVLLRAKKELTGKDEGWILYSYLKPESVRAHPEATVRPWATCHSLGHSLYKRGFLFRRGTLVIQMFQQEQVDPTTQEPIPAHPDTLWEVEVKTATPIQNTQETPLSQSIDAVLEVQLLMKGLLDLRRQDV
ncbi:hypothetical protein BT96DRAFT_955079 [Gymnopus androsaceus JB14]|uniref:Mediator complex subunit 18 n=1 Tax=Gymnopus androsaceus JB14 TaxID=1447944 RepID=A0A6A4I2I4_9AGAR|nr:hypothetical protein BT96DRAFT_955079 [Gymnopus androsaceus JB14]